MHDDGVDLQRMLGFTSSGDKGKGTRLIVKYLINRYKSDRKRRKTTPRHFENYRTRPRIEDSRKRAPFSLIIILKALPLLFRSALLPSFATSGLWSATVDGYTFPILSTIIWILFFSTTNQRWHATCNHIPFYIVACLLPILRVMHHVLFCFSLQWWYKAALNGNILSFGTLAFFVKNHYSLKPI